MTQEITWIDVGLRLVLTLVAGGILGANREGRGHPAGLRTTELVCLTASASLILANLLLNTSGNPARFITFDLMRLPQGILTGVGFIGAGVILHRENLVMGVTTAATLWFATLLGFCFGSGEFGLGLTMLAAGMAILWGMAWLEARLFQKKKATLTLLLSFEGPSLAHVTEALQRGGHLVSLMGIEYTEETKELRYEVHWSAFPYETAPPEYVAQLAGTAGVKKLSWLPMVKA